MCVKFLFFILIFFKGCVSEKINLKSSATDIKNKLVNFFHINDYKKMLHKLEVKRQNLKNRFNIFLNKALCVKKTQSTKKPTFRVNDYTEDEKTMSAIQLIRHHGYQAETHPVQTRDGYVLDIHRILTIFPKFERVKKEKLALLYHGLLGSSEDWLLLGPGRALPYLLSDAGYDVWLANARGNKYTRFDHDFLILDTPALWDFSFHEMGYFDLAAIIDYIKSRNKNDLEINFIGYSMGCSALLVLLSTLPQYNQVLYSATLLAPLAFMFQPKGPLKLLAEFYKNNGRDSLNFLGENEFMANQNFPHEFIERYCIGAQKLCLNPLLLLANGGKVDLEIGFLDNLLRRIPAKTSKKTIEHYLQLVSSGKFQNFDYGTTENLKRHGVVVAPTYDLSKVTLPILLFSSSTDWLCTMPNIETLVHTLPNVVSHQTIDRTDFSHTDFVWGESAPELIFYPLLDILEIFDYTKAI